MLAEKECEGLSRQCCTAGPSQNATFPNFNSSRIIHVPTDLTYVLARVLVFNDSDQAAANALSQNITINPYNVSGLVLHASLLLFRDVYNTQMHSACSADNVATDKVLADLGLFSFAWYRLQTNMYFAGTATKAAQISAAFNGSGYGSLGTQAGYVASLLQRPATWFNATATYVTVDPPGISLQSSHYLGHTSHALRQVCASCTVTIMVRCAPCSNVRHAQMCRCSRLSKR